MVIFNMFVRSYVKKEKYIYKISLSETHKSLFHLSTDEREGGGGEGALNQRGGHNPPHCNRCIYVATLKKLDKPYILKNFNI